MPEGAARRAVDAQQEAEDVALRVGDYGRSLDAEISQSNTLCWAKV